jgi:hypothetical protein
LYRCVAQDTARDGHSGFKRLICLYATAGEFESWERHMLQGFYRCATYDHNMDDCTHLALVDRRVDGKLYSWWHKALREKSITSATWANFRKFL